jgi:hypothetical protein
MKMNIKNAGSGISLRTLLATLLLVAISVTSRAEVLLTCPGLSGGDHYYRGFYIPA